MNELTIHKIDFFVALVDEFARRFSLSDSEAYRYIHQYGGVQAFFDHYDILHTLSFRDMVEWMAGVCSRQGGQLQ